MTIPKSLSPKNNSIKANESINNIKNYNDKKRSILGEILLIKLLKEIDIDYNELTIKKNKYGKPYIINNKFYYNISHSHDYVICAISNKKIGIDIEKIRPVNKRIATQFSTNNELKYINEYNNNQLVYKRFFTIFTLKEAYFKCIGTNLNNIKKLEFNLNASSIISNKKNYKFNTKIINNYVIAICEHK